MPARPTRASADASRSAPRRSSGQQLAVELAHLVGQMRCEEVVVLDLRGLSSVCDYFVIATGTSDRQMRAIADAVDEHAASLGHQRYGLAGYDRGTWILVDYVDVVIHIFDTASRNYYDLELLWGDAPRLHPQE
jgi:ribosome-associated protein